MIMQKKNLRSNCLRLVMSFVLLSGSNVAQAMSYWSSTFIVPLEMSIPYDSIFNELLAGHAGLCGGSNYGAAAPVLGGNLYPIGTGYNQWTLLLPTGSFNKNTSGLITNGDIVHLEIANAKLNSQPVCLGYNASTNMLNVTSVANAAYFQVVVSGGGTWKDSSYMAQNTASFILVTIQNNTVVSTGYQLALIKQSAKFSWNGNATSAYTYNMGLMPTNTAQAPAAVPAPSQAGATSTSRSYYFNFYGGQR